MKGDDIQTYYDQIAADFASRESYRYHRFVNDVSERFIRRNLSPGQVLDAGCGCGHMGERLASTRFRMFGLDLSLSMLRNRTSQYTMPAAAGSIGLLPFADNAFDGLICLRVLPHVPERRTALEEFARVVRPGGHVIIDYYNIYSLRALISKIRGRRCSKSTQPLFTQFDSYRSILADIPDSLIPVEQSGIRIITPVGRLMDCPALGDLLILLESTLTKTALHRVGGFMMLHLVRKSEPERDPNLNLNRNPDQN
ncbi:class I SAM-dependent methyltransferase [bacterium]|nr:class I SAM-dependent methyltransferase [candidate division CSSED10-310 bacterium]